MALSAQVIRLFERYDFPVRKPERVTVIGIVAVKAPPARHVVQHDVLMHHLELSGSPVYRHALVALRAGENAF